MANVGSRFAKDANARSRSLEARLGKRQASFISDVANTGNEKGMLRRAASSSLAQRFGRVRGVSGNLAQSLRRAKARQQILGRGDKAIENQQFKDRISIGRQQLARRGATLRNLGSADRLRDDIASAGRLGKDRVRQAKFGAFGAILGGVTSGLQGTDFFNRAGKVDPITDQGTALSDRINQDSFGDSFDFDDPAPNVFEERFA